MTISGSSSFFRSEILKGAIAEELVPMDHKLQ